MGASLGRAGTGDVEGEGGADVLDAPDGAQIELGVLDAERGEGRVGLGLEHVLEGVAVELEERVVERVPDDGAVVGTEVRSDPASAAVAYGCGDRARVACVGVE